MQDEKADMFTIEDDTDNEPIETVELDEGFNPLLISIGQYELFLAGGKVGGDAKDVFLHLMYTARRQQTNQVWANDEYIRSGIGIGRDSLIKAKKWLVDKGMISYIRERRPTENTDGKRGGTLGKSYIRLNYIHRKCTVDRAEADQTPENRGVVNDQTPDNQVPGQQQQMLKVNKENALSEKEEGGSSYVDPSSTASAEQPANPPPPLSIKEPELLERIKEIRKLYNDTPPPLIQDKEKGIDEPRQAVEAARKHGHNALLTWLAEILRDNKEKRSKPLRYLFEDYGHLLKEEKPEPRPEPDRCPHGHIDRDLCPECFEIDYGHEENPLELEEAMG
jgi:hypothetical protein